MHGITTIVLAGADCDLQIGRRSVRAISGETSNGLRRGSLAGREIRSHDPGEHRTRRTMASSSSAIEKLVFIAPLRPGLNHRCSHNFVVSSPALPIQYLPSRADLLSNISLLWRGLLRARLYISSTDIGRLEDENFTGESRNG